MDARSAVSAMFAVVMVVGAMAPSAATAAALINPTAIGVPCGSTPDCAAAQTVVPPTPGTALGPGDELGLSALPPTGDVVAAPPAAAGTTLPSTSGAAGAGSSTVSPAAGDAATGSSATGSSAAGVNAAGENAADEGAAGEGASTGELPAADPADETPTSTDTPSTPPAGDTDPSDPATTTPEPTSTPATAAEAQGWGAPQRVDDFRSAEIPWTVRSGAADDGQRYDPAAVTVTDGVLGLGAGQGGTGAVVTDTGAPFGRWEARLRAPRGAAGYTPLLTLSTGTGEPGGTLEFASLADPTRQQAGARLLGTSGTGTVQVDATQWHQWAVEWTPQGITAFVDGRRWWSVDRSDADRTGPLRLGIEVRRSASAGSPPAGSVLDVDWVAFYPAPADQARAAVAVATPSPTSAETTPEPGSGG